MSKKLFLSFAIATLLAPIGAVAQRDRIAGRIDRNRTVVIRGNVHPSAQARFDEGAVDPAMNMDLVTLMLKPSPDQQASLEQLLSEQQNPASPNYHHWLTPEEYADRFGISGADLAKIQSWLQSEGLTVDDASRGRNWIVFHGMAAQIQSAFHTEIHHYNVNGELHFANATEPSIPAAIEPLVMGILGLHDFKPKAAHGRVKTISANGDLPSPTPDFTSGSSHYLAPDDLATIYDIKPLYSAGIDGTGQKIVVVGQSDIALADIRSFRTKYNLSSMDPQIILAPGSPDPGTVSDDEGEADLDLEWTGAVARNATIIYVNSKNADFSAQYAISQNLAPVISYSFSGCELQSPAGFGGVIRSVAQQAAIQGITWLASSGDSGAAGCDPQGQNGTAQQGISVGLPASVPEVTGVGGTQFNEGNGSYWATSNNTNLASALSYIPETAWNESSSANGLLSGGGGLSILYSKPSWQTGPGVPSSNARAVPDIALTAAGHDGYLVMNAGQLIVVAGTSAAAPSFAGMIALLNQYQSAHGGSSSQGNINPNLYQMAQTATGVFHDITTGNNIVPCTSAAAGCSSGSYGYNAGLGYDLVTGLGSVDANNLVTQWKKGTVTPPTPQPPFHLQPFSGDVQFAAAGSVLPQPVVVSAQDANGLPMAGITVTFSAVLGGGSVSPASAVTNSSGLAQTQMTLGSAAGYQVLLASANQFASTGVVEIAGTSSTGFGLAYGKSGDNQTATVNTALPVPLTLTVADSTGKVLPGIPVAWLVTAGGGSVTASAAVTDSNGKISANWKLGSLVGTQTVQAIPFYFNGVSIYGFHGLTFTATGLTSGSQPQAPFHLQPISGDIQAAAAGSALPQPVVVGARDVNGLPIPGVTVTFSVALGGGSVSPTTSVTNSSGLAQTQMTLGPSSGTQVLLATANQFASTGVLEIAGASATFGFNYIQTGDKQTGTISTALPAPITLTVSDSTGQVLPGIPVAWSVTAGGGSVTPLAAVTDSAGKVSANWTLGASTGNQTVQAIPFDFNGVSIYGLHGTTFTATAQTGSGSGAPNVPTNGIVNGAGFSSSVAGLSPGAIVSIFGTGLSTAPASGVQPGLMPGTPTLYTTSNGTTVTFDGVAAPLFFVSPNQLNVQVPFEVAGKSLSQVVVSRNGSTSASVGVRVLPATPGLFTADSSGGGPAALLNADGSTNTSNNAAAAGTVIQLFATGLGAVSPSGITGVLAPGAEPLARSMSNPNVTLGGVPAPVQFSGLAPNFVGLWQVNVVVPAGAGVGAVPLVLTTGGQNSNQVTVFLK